MNERGLELALRKMREAGLSGAAVSSFERAWRQAAAGETGLMPEAGLESAGGIPALADVASASPDPSFLDRLCVIKLNGGLGTGMGLERAKSLIRVKDGLTFLDLIAQQILWMRETHGTRGPKFLLMDSFSTSADTVSFLAKYPELASGGALDFLQNKVPKILADSLEPVEWAAAPDMEWCPPGHGDLYAALSGSGLLDQLAADGVEYLFVSNSDNLGATADPGLLAYFAGSGLSFLMEVAERTSSDRKGGHLARRMSDGRLVLREVAQCPDEDMETFQDIARHRFFNTNNLWLRVSDLRAALAAQGGSLPLPLITNIKTVDPRDPASPKVLQLESAMGAAIECFPQAGAVLVPRTRFSPVKTTSDLLALRSDAYVVTGDRRLELAPGCRGTPPEVVLDGDCYKLLPGLEAAFGEDAPSLCGCSRFEVHGPWLFETGVVCGGAVRFVNRGAVPARARGGIYRDVTESA